MASLREEQQILIKAGLTLLQAKVYLPLCKIEKASITAISKAASVDRANVYRTITALQKMGLIEQTIGFPNLYQAVPLVEGIKILMGQKRAKNQQIEEEISNFLPEIAHTKRRKSEQNQILFLIVAQNHGLIQKIEKELQSAQCSVDVITTAKRFPYVMDHFQAMFKEALERQVTLRLITQKPRSENGFSKAMLTQFADSNFKMRFSPDSLVANIAVFDGKRAMLTVDPTLAFGESPSLWTNHLGLIAVLEEHFERIWSKQENQHLETQTTQLSI